MTEYVFEQASFYVGDKEVSSVAVLTKEMRDRELGKPFKGSTRFLGEQGDILIVWTESEDEAQLAAVQKKLDEGFAFFIVESRAFGLLSPKKTQLTNVENQKELVLKTRTLELKDVDFDNLLAAGKVAITDSNDEKEIKTTGKAKTAKEVLEKNTVCVQPRKGG